MRTLRSSVVACAAAVLFASLLVAAPTAFAGDTHAKLSGSWELDLAATEKQTREAGKVPAERIEAMMKMMQQTASMVGWQIDDKTMTMRRGDQKQVLPYTVDEEKDGKLVVTAQPPKESGQAPMKMTIVVLDDDHLMMQSGKPGDVDTIVWKRVEEKDD